ncbi:1-phosphatidylinositol-3-phosphate 5-kinase [Elysia marginata]|uniref:1-phosphatidylinositol-3-phosphate 5-kinase n=1 Tax=Elysia marginata TaxID=1093978 RepID=A0AAV4F4E6_9GAST|nr:1-phosphatidylinositol-3-phosphate 5-kinase [Elysia marginata]
MGFFSIQSKFVSINQGSTVSAPDGQDGSKSSAQSNSVGPAVSHTASPTLPAASAPKMAGATIETKDGQSSDSNLSAAQSSIPATGPKEEESTLSSSSTSATTTTTTTAAAAGTGQLAPQINQVQSSQLTPAATEGQEDTTDGWFQDLKGVTRRWLSTSSFTPLPLPFDASEHHMLPMCEKVPITVYDYEPSSIVAYTLSSSDYLYRLREIQNGNRASSQPNSSAGSHQGRSRNKSGENILAPGNAADLAGESGKKAGVLSFLRGSSRETSPHSVSQSVPVQTQQQQNSGKKYLSFETVRYLPSAEGNSYTANIGSGDDSLFSPEDASPSPEEKPKVGGSSAPSPHIEMQFSDSTAKFYCRVYFADQFRKLRKLLLPGGENRFIRSLSRCKPWEAKGGKSGSSFSKTDDDRFILKQMSNMEVDSFEKFGPQYFQYLKTCLSEEQPTALAKILGVYRIGFRNSQTNHALRQDVLVMENLFYNRRISQKFDLKGSMRNRMVNTNSKRGEEELVLLDENLLKSSVESPLYMRPHSKHVLRSAISSDSTFLSQNLVMDYSLLVGVDDATQELVVGIIDYIRTFTWDKKLEMVVKSSGILGGQGKMPTVVSPQLYKSRFLEAMDRYFLHVPDYWMGLGRDSPLRSTKIEQMEQKDLKKQMAYT